MCVKEKKDRVHARMFGGAFALRLGVDVACERRVQEYVHLMHINMHACTTRSPHVTTLVDLPTANSCRTRRASGALPLNGSNKCSLP